MRVLDALAAGDDAAAFTAFETLVAAAAPETVDWLRRAWVAIPGGDAEVFAQAVAAARGDAVAMHLLFARVAFGAGFAACGVACARDAARQSPTHAEPALLLCAMFLSHGAAEANAILQHCLERFAGPAQGYLTLAGILLDRGKAEAALVCLARAPGTAAVAIRRGLIGRDLGRLDAARAAFAEAVALDPRSVRAWFLLGHCAQEQRDFPAAAAAYAAVLARDSGVAEAALNLGTVRQETGDLDGAKAAYRQAVRTRADAFGRVAQALTTAPRGELWLDLGELRRDLAG